MRDHAPSADPRIEPRPARRQTRGKREAVGISAVARWPPAGRQRRVRMFCKARRRCLCVLALTSAVLEAPQPDITGIICARPGSSLPTRLLWMRNHYV
jgi:hypothetical protein